MLKIVERTVEGVVLETQNGHFALQAVVPQTIDMVCIFTLFLLLILYYALFNNKIQDKKEVFYRLKTNE
jgi:hypothetical protein